MSESDTKKCVVAVYTHLKRSPRNSHFKKLKNNTTAFQNVILVRSSFENFIFYTIIVVEYFSNYFFLILLLFVESIFCNYFGMSNNDLLLE